MGRLDGKVALVTGAARGQGEAEARLFTQEGAKVVLADVLDAEGERVAADIGDAAAYRHLDVTSEQDWQDAVAFARERFGKLDVLVNNAGILKITPIADMSVDDYMAVILVNQLGTWLGMKSALPALREAGGGSIVNISSTAGFVGIFGMSAYVASKFAVRGMTKTAAIEFGPYGIRVNSIHPGGVDTPMVRNIGLGDALEEGVRGQPLGRISDPIEIARLALFLASDESSFSTGSEFVADGGQLAGGATAQVSPD